MTRFLCLVLLAVPLFASLGAGCGEPRKCTLISLDSDETRTTCDVEPPPEEPEP